LESGADADLIVLGKRNRSHPSLRVTSYRQSGSLVSIVDLSTQLPHLIKNEDPFTGPALTVDQVWKLGAKIHDTDKAAALAVSWCDNHALAFYAQCKTTTPKRL
jgi:hypothetical protein